MRRLNATELAEAIKIALACGLNSESCDNILNEVEEEVQGMPLVTSKQARANSQPQPCTSRAAALAFASQIALPNPPPSPPRAELPIPRSPAFISAVKATETSNFWLHRFGSAMTADIIAGNVEEVLLVLEVNKVKTFFIFHTVEKAAYLLHTCAIPSKQNCRCIGLDLVAIREKRVNCNYFQPAAPSAVALLVCAAKRAHFRCVRLTINADSFTYRDVTVDVYRTFDFSLEGTMFSPAVLGRNFKKWSAISKSDGADDEAVKDADEIIGMLDHEEAAPRLLECKNETEVNFINGLLWTFVPFPATDLYQVPDVANSMYKYISANLPEYQIALQRFNCDFDVMLISDLYAHLKSRKCKPVFNVKKEYLSKDESVSLIKNWLAFQFDNDAVRVTDFLVAIYAILTQSCDAKLNGIWVQGPASSGKSFTFSALAELHVRVAHVDILDDKYAFNFQCCANKKIVFMDEACLPNSLRHVFLKLLSGIPMSVNVKNATAQFTNRMPILMLSNNDVVDMRENVWNTRIFHTQVKSLPAAWPKQEKAIFPLAWLDVFEEYGVMK